MTDKTTAHNKPYEPQDDEAEVGLEGRLWLALFGVLNEQQHGLLGILRESGALLPLDRALRAVAGKLEAPHSSCGVFNASDTQQPERQRIPGVADSTMRTADPEQMTEH